MPTQDFQVGLLPCVVTRQHDKCICVPLGHLNTEDQGAVEVWTHISETGLLSLRADLLAPNPTDGRTYRVSPGECCVTGEAADCIYARVGNVSEYREEQPTGRVAQIDATLSLAGIDRLLEQLRAAPLPVNLTPFTTAREETPYGWAVIHSDHRVVSQFPLQDDGSEGEEIPFREVRLDQVQVLTIHPRHPMSALPSYRLDQTGFSCYSALFASFIEMLPLPVPRMLFQFRYFRRVTVQVFGQRGAGEALPPHIVQVIGWRLKDLVCELGVEEDGSWAIYRRGRVRVGTDDDVEPLAEEEFAAALAAVEERIG